MKKSKTLFLALTATMLVACAPPSDPSMSEPSTSEPSTNTSPSPTTGTMFSDFTVTSSDSVLLLIGNESKIEVQETDVIFTSENPDIATVDSSGTIKAKNVGSTKIVLLYFLLQITPHSKIPSGGGATTATIPGEALFTPSRLT